MIDKTYAKAIRFNTEMVQAILDGRKTVTRISRIGVPMKKMLDEEFCYLECKYNYESYSEYDTGYTESDCELRAEAQKGEPFVCPFTNTEYEVTDKESEVQ